MRPNRRLLETMTLIAATSAPISGALAQEGSPPAEGSPDVQPIAPLQGPKVNDERAPGVDSRFSMDMERSRESERPIPPRIYEQELRKLEGDKVDESVRLSMEQQQAIRKIIQEHRRELRAFYAEHREEIAAIRGASASDTMRRAGGNAQGQRRGQNQGKNQGQGAGNEQDAMGESAKPDTSTGLGARRNQGGGARNNAMSQEAREKMQALRAKGPQESVAITRIWDALSEAQRDHLSARFESIRAETMRQRETQKRGGSDDKGQGASARERLESMTPEQRRALRERRKAGQTPPVDADD